MASILPSYGTGVAHNVSYDIFISYRHKDNMYDGWVTEFVDALKRELDATFKDPISVYFDENPHDGLLETHNVDKSLEGKLKCLIFIPIISQTYCDTKSFAWQHEFITFNKLAQEDSLGRDITLHNGNVTSRILPVKIHELDDEDKETIAILPFEDMSPGGDQEYFSDGIAAELINVLSKQPGLRVTGRTSSFHYKGREVNIKTIGEELGVEAILEGSVRKSGIQW
ncbi:MAG: hypothetical protein OEW75_10535 [Cyclobacteriaceae bacterium]|nr:hypothetical protein [Cyclobacteriaceae bacterium]